MCVSHILLDPPVLLVLSHPGRPRATSLSPSKRAWYQVKGVREGRRAEQVLCSGPGGPAPQCGPALPSSDLSLRSQPRSLTCSPRPDSPGRCSGCRATNGDGQRALEIEWSVTWRGEEDFCARWSGAAVVGPDSLCSAASPDWLHQGGSAGVQSREAAVSSGWGAGCARRSLNGSMCRGNSAQGRWAVTSRFIHSSCGCLLSTDLGEASRRVHLWRRQ